jgi:hypothetical protein
MYICINIYNVVSPSARSLQNTLTLTKKDHFKNVFLFVLIQLTKLNNDKHTANFITVKKIQLTEFYLSLKFV